MILFIITITVYLTYCTDKLLNNECETNLECDDGIWCNGVEECYKETCVNCHLENTPCHINTTDVETKESIKIHCHEKLKECFYYFKCGKTSDCMFLKDHECNTTTYLCQYIGNRKSGNIKKPDYLINIPNGRIQTKQLHIDSISIKNATVDHNTKFLPFISSFTTIVGLLSLFLLYTAYVLNKTEKLRKQYQ
jgi:hypothetical protein